MRLSERIACWRKKRKKERKKERKPIKKLVSAEEEIRGPTTNKQTNERTEKKKKKKKKRKEGNIAYKQIYCTSTTIHVLGMLGYVVHICLEEWEIVMRRRRQLGWIDGWTKTRN